MPKLVAPLTTTRINAAKPGSTVVKLSDGGGLALWVMPTGKKVWRLQYRRPLDGKQDTVTIGNYPEVSLAAARERREALRADLAAKKDPKLEDRRREMERQCSDALTFRHVSQEWWDRWKESVTPGYADQVWRVLEANVFHTLGGMPVNDIRPPHIVKALSPMEARGALVYLRRAHNTMSMIFAFAVARGLIEYNPASDLSGAFKSPETSNFRALKPEQLALLLSALPKDDINFQTRCLIKWQLLTISRPREAASARWDEIDGDIWTIPASKMKRRRDHMVPLSRQAIALLEEMRPLSGHLEYVFPHRNNPREHANEGSANVALKRLDVPTTAHGLRALASTTLNEKGFDGRVVEMALAHADQNSTRAAYNRAEYITQRREMLQWWADHIDKTDKEVTSQ
ncbi:tyrosine-type recombinase/integrase [Chromobacterium vaccinii]|nr:tyrosine-type recombinase/integrase [Chromobacterium vaccinii]